MQFDRGFISPYFITDTEKMECVYDNPFILLYDKKVSNLKDILPILEGTAQSGRGLLIIAEDVDQDASQAWLSTVSAAASRFALSKLPASATAAKKCSRISLSSPAAL